MTSMLVPNDLLPGDVEMSEEFSTTTLLQSIDRDLPEVAKGCLPHRSIDTSGPSHPQKPPGEKLKVPKGKLKISPRGFCRSPKWLFKGRAKAHHFKKKRDRFRFFLDFKAWKLFEEQALLKSSLDFPGANSSLVIEDD